MGFHFPLMPRLYLSLLEGDRSPLEWILDRTPDLHEANQWCIFLRNHDELTLEMVTEEERQKLWDHYAPEPRMRLNLGIRRRLAPLMGNDVRKIALLNSMLFTLPGSPILYYGDEIGMGDQIDLFDRNGVRTPMQWTPDENAGFSPAPTNQLYAPVIDNDVYGYKKVNIAAQVADSDSLFNTIRRMISVRKEHQVFSWGGFHWVEVGTKKVAAYIRNYDEGLILVLNNLSGSAQTIDLNQDYQDLLTGQVFSTGELVLSAYQYLWLIPA
jgi:maltose alpha-D-glucosyltransferase/alpha-amylase